MSERESIAVTPPQNDTPAMRQWLHDSAADRGWTDLQWADELDAYQTPMGRLTGIRPTKEPA